MSRTEHYYLPTMFVEHSWGSQLEVRVTMNLRRGSCPISTHVPSCTQIYERNLEVYLFLYLFHCFHSDLHQWHKIIISWKKMISIFFIKYQTFQGTPSEFQATPHGAMNPSLENIDLQSKALWKKEWKKKHLSLFIGLAKGKNSSDHSLSHSCLLKAIF